MSKLQKTYHFSAVRSFLVRHSRTGWNPEGSQRNWIPACAGMTNPIVTLFGVDFQKAKLIPKNKKLPTSLTYLKFDHWLLEIIWDLACLREAAPAKAGAWRLKFAVSLYITFP